MLQLRSKATSTAAAILLRTLAQWPGAGSHFLAQPQALPGLLAVLRRAAEDARAACYAASCLSSLAGSSEKVRRLLCT